MKLDSIGRPVHATGGTKKKITKDFLVFFFPPQFHSFLRKLKMEELSQLIAWVENRDSYK
jgi:hypothetical protein